MMTVKESPLARGFDSGTVKGRPMTSWWFPRINWIQLDTVRVAITRHDTSTVWPPISTLLTFKNAVSSLHRSSESVSWRTRTANLHDPIDLIGMCYQMVGGRASEALFAPVDNPIKGYMSRRYIEVVGLRRRIRHSESR
jgi:hypothetical protein